MAIWHHKRINAMTLIACYFMILSPSYMKYTKLQTSIASQLLNEKVGATKDEKRWIKNFAQADIAFEQLCYRWSKINGSEKSFSTIGESIKLVRKIQQKMDQVNTPEYKEQLLRDIAKFSRWMVLFSGNELLPHEVNKKLDDSSQSKQPEVQTPVAKAVAPANKKPLQAQIGNDSFSFVLEQQDMRSDSVFYC